MWWGSQTSLVLADMVASPAGIGRTGFEGVTRRGLAMSNPAVLGKCYLYMFAVLCVTVAGMVSDVIFAPALQTRLCHQRMRSCSNRLGGCLDMTRWCLLVKS